MSCVFLHDPVTGNTRKAKVDFDRTFGGTLRVEDVEGGRHDVALRDFVLASGGWRGTAVTFTWDENGDRWALTVDDPAVIAALEQQLPTDLAGNIREWQRRSRGSRRRSGIALTIGLLLTLTPILLLVALFVMRDRVIDAALSRVPVEIDNEIGLLMHEEIVKSGKHVTRGPAVDAVRAVGSRLTANVPASHFRFRFEVLNDPSVNAFATPGGLVVVHTGLISHIDSVDELAGVLSHEMTHVLERHSLRQMLYSVGLRTAIAYVFGWTDGAAETLAGAAVNWSGLKFSRDQEIEADAGGVDLLQQASLPAEGLRQFFERSARNSGNIPAFLSTHPSDEERLSRLKQIVAERPAWNVQPLNIDLAAVRGR